MFTPDEIQHALVCQHTSYPPRVAAAVDLLVSALEVMTRQGRIAVVTSAAHVLKDPAVHPQLRPYYRAVGQLAAALNIEEGRQDG